MVVRIQKLINRLFKPVTGLIMVFASTACSPIKALNAIVPDRTYELESNVAYAKLSRQTLDIYTPKSRGLNNTSTLKTLVFFYGGNWDSGEKEDYKFVAEALASQGHIVVIPNYRVYPDVKFPELMTDPTQVAKWVKSNITTYGGDSNQIFLGGHSAGAHIAVMMAVNPEYLARVSLNPYDFAGVIGLAGPYDFLPLESARLKIIFGDESQRWKSQPINFVDGKNPPMLLAVGLKDTTVGPRNTYNLAQKIQMNNGLVKIVEFAQYNHVDMVAKLAKPLRGNGDLLKSVADFMQNTSFTKNGVNKN